MNGLDVAQVTPVYITNLYKNGPAGQRVEVNAQSFMAGPGQYARATMASGVRAIFSDNSLRLGGNRTYTNADLASMGYQLNSSAFEIDFNQALMNQSSQDYKQRAYVFGNQNLSITFDGVFVSDEQIFPVNLRIVPNREDFDFQSVGANQGANDRFFQPYVDPYETGNAVIIDYVDIEDLPAISFYGSEQFASDTAFVARNAVSSFYTAQGAGAFLSLYRDLYQAGKGDTHRARAPTLHTSSQSSLTA